MNKEKILDIVNSLLAISEVKTTRKNFVENFLTKHRDSRIYHNLKLFGTVSYRPSSGGGKNDGLVNGLNFPASSSPLAPSIKKCFTAPKDKILLAVDLSAL
jgi:hypothetical protein